MYTIRLYGDPGLRTKAKPVTEFGDKLKAIAAEMVQTMREKDGVGLAAQQVGLRIRLAVVDATNGEKPALVLVNPEVTETSDQTEEHEEGCLSFPGINLKITRPARVSVKAQDVDGKMFVVEHAEGLLGRALQHEIDHLNALMIIDRVSLLQRQLISGKLKKLVQEHSEDLQPA